MDHSASNDLWRNTLAQIPSILGQLVYLSSLWDPNSGRYRHLGLEARVGAQEGDATMRTSHERLFRDWLRLSMTDKRDDCVLHLSAVGEKPPRTAANWIESRWYLSLAPKGASDAEREDFRLHLEILLVWITNAASAAGPNRDA